MSVPRAIILSLLARDSLRVETSILSTSSSSIDPFIAGAQNSEFSSSVSNPASIISVSATGYTFESSLLSATVVPDDAFNVPLTAALTSVSTPGTLSAATMSTTSPTSLTEPTWSTMAISPYLPLDTQQTSFTGSAYADAYPALAYSPKASSIPVQTIPADATVVIPASTTNALSVLLSAYTGSSSFPDYTPSFTTTITTYLGSESLPLITPTTTNALSVLLSAYTGSATFQTYSPSYSTTFFVYEPPSTSLSVSTDDNGNSATDGPIIPVPDPTVSEEPLATTSSTLSTESASDTPSAPTTTRQSTRTSKSTTAAGIPSSVAFTYVTPTETIAITSSQRSTSTGTTSNGASTITRTNTRTTTTKPSSDSSTLLTSTITRTGSNGTITKTTRTVTSTSESTAPPRTSIPPVPPENNQAGRSGGAHTYIVVLMLAFGLVW